MPIFPEFYSFKKKLPHPKKKSFMNKKSHEHDTHLFLMLKKTGSKNLRFDVVTNTVSVDYLTKPLQVFQEVGRVLRPGRDQQRTNRCLINLRFGCETIYCFSIPGEGLDKCPQMKRGEDFCASKQTWVQIFFSIRSHRFQHKMVTFGLVLCGLFRSRQETTFLDS